MKTLLMIILSMGTLSTVAQESYQRDLFSADVVLKYRADIGLTQQQVEHVKKIYDDQISTFNSKKWDLDAELVALNKYLSQAHVDENTSMVQLEKVLKLESELKQMKLSMLIKIKNELKESQQAQLKKLSTGRDLTYEGITTIMNENPRLIIRATGSQDGEKPLILVNGERVSDLTNFDPETIASVTVLKDKAALKPYGIDGANGVILITLK